MHQKQKPIKKLPIFATYISLTFLVVSLFFSFQVLFVFKTFNPTLLVVPFTAALLFGMLLSTAVYYKKRFIRKSAFYKSIADFSQEFIFTRNQEGEYTYVSPSCEEITGYSDTDFYKNKSIMDSIIHPSQLDQWHNHEHSNGSRGTPESIDFKIITKYGSIKHIAHLCSETHDEEGNYSGTKSANLDITQRVEQEKQIKHMAYYDELTQLPNRYSLFDHCKILIANDVSFTIALIDLDRFKLINDVYSHTTGDLILVEIAERLNDFVSKQHSSLYASRIGGDEFAIVSIVDVAPEQCKQRAKSLIKLFHQPIAIEDKTFELTCSTGVSVYPFDGKDIESLIRNADTAMYKAKTLGRNQIQCYKPEYRYALNAFYKIEQNLKKAITNKEIFLHYQPIYNLQTMQISHAEGLARWDTKTEFIPPSEFIEIAEETGKINQLSKLLLKQACEERQLINTPDFKFAINISPIYFQAKDFCESIDKTMQGFDKNDFIFEITENHLISKDIDALSKAQNITDNNIELAIDDFGTGYSALHYVRD